MPTPTDAKLYERVKKDLFSIYTKTSAVQKYKDENVKNIKIIIIILVIEKLQI